MRILSVHNYYQQPGGEDIVFESEATLLESRGHEVFREEFRNQDIPEDPSWVQSGHLALQTVWSREAERRIRDAIRRINPDIAHFHNTFPLVSPAGYAACRKEGVPVVQTLHNYRAICSKAQFFRDGRVCEDCLGRRLTWPGIVHACYRDSRPMSATVSAMQLTSRALGSWHSDVSVFIATSDVVREKHLAGGFPSNSVVVKPHFVDPDPGPGDHRGEFAVYVGRLSPEKGVSTLLRAWNEFPVEMPLKIIGGGPMAGVVEEASRRNRLIEWIGTRPINEVVRIVGDAELLVFPSIWQEPFGRTIIEAYARGTPVVASDIGASLELVRPGRTGTLFSTGDAVALGACVSELAADPSRLNEMGCQARVLFEQEYTAEPNYRQLIGIYEYAMDRAAQTGPRR